MTRLFCIVRTAVLCSAVGAFPAVADEIQIHPGDSFETAAEALQAGDTLVVHAGTYSHSGRLAIDAHGTQQQPVVITGADGEAKPLIVLTNSGQNVVNIEGATWLTVRGLEITANGLGGADGINMSGGPSNITLEDLTIHDISVGINFRSTMSDITARRNHIYNTNDTGEGMYVGCHDGSCAVSNSIIEYNWIHDTTQAEQGDGIEIKRGSYSNIIRDNVIHDTKFPCLLLYGTDGHPRNIVERNVAWNCADAAIQVAADAIVRNNIFIPGSGRGIASQPHAGVNPNNLEFTHNTIIGGSPCLYVSDWSNKTGMIFANNAVYCSGGSYTFSGLSGVSISGNVFDQLPSSVSTTTNTAGRSANEDFLDVDSRNVYPTSDSALLSAGDSAYVTSADFNSTPRNPGLDAGAYTWTAAVNPGWTVTAGFKDESAAGPAVMLTADPASIDYQGQATLTWSATDVTSCTASGGWVGAKPAQGEETTGPLTESTTYTLTCTGSDSEIAAESVTVTVTGMPQPANAPTLTFNASAASVALNGSVDLTWASTNSTLCTATGNWSGQKSLSGTESTGALSSAATFTLECQGAGGAVSRAVTVDIQADVDDTGSSNSESGGGALSLYWLLVLSSCVWRVTSRTSNATQSPQ